MQRSDFDTWLQGLPAFDAVLARDSDNVVLLSCRAAYPSGLRLALTLLRRVPLPEVAFAMTADDDPIELLTLEFAAPGSASIRWLGSTGWGATRQDNRLTVWGSNFASRRLNWDLWMSPLPAPEPMTITVTTPDGLNAVNAARILTPWRRLNFDPRWLGRFSVFGGGGRGDAA